MKIYYTLAALPLALAGCTPSGDLAAADAIAACQRADVQDVVGKEVRNMMLKAAADRMFVAAAFGIDMAKAMEQARTSFSEIGVYTTGAGATAPFKQIICGGSLQVDGSTATSGQDIVTIPRLRWSVNFAQPTEEPSTAAFSIAVDPVSISDGVLVNGEPAKTGEVSDSGPTEKEPAPPEARGMSEAEQAAAAASAAAAEAMADAREAQALDDMPLPSGRKPNEEDLYAPHGN